MGAAQNSQSCDKGSPPAKKACDNDLAGFTEVFVVEHCHSLQKPTNTFRKILQKVFS
jgi:hypothetical protein